MGKRWSSYYQIAINNEQNGKKTILPFVDLIKNQNMTNLTLLYTFCSEYQSFKWKQITKTSVFGYTNGRTVS